MGRLLLPESVGDKERLEGTSESFSGDWTPASRVDRLRFEGGVVGVLFFCGVGAATVFRERTTLAFSAVVVVSSEIV